MAPWLLPALYTAAKVGIPMARGYMAKGQQEKYNRELEKEQSISNLIAALSRGRIQSQATVAPPKERGLSKILGAIGTGMGAYDTFKGFQNARAEEEFLQQQRGVEQELQGLRLGEAKRLLDERAGEELAQRIGINQSPDRSISVGTGPLLQGPEPAPPGDALPASYLGVTGSPPAQKPRREGSFLSKIRPSRYAPGTGDLSPKFSGADLSQLGGAGQAAFYQEQRSQQQGFDENIRKQEERDLARRVDESLILSRHHKIDMDKGALAQSELLIQRQALSKTLEDRLALEKLDNKKTQLLRVTQTVIDNPRLYGTLGTQGKWDVLGVLSDPELKLDPNLITDLTKVDMTVGDRNKFADVFAASINFSDLELQMEELGEDFVGMADVVWDKGTLSDTTRRRLARFDAKLGLVTQSLGKALQGRMTDEDLKLIKDIVGSRYTTFNGLRGRFDAVGSFMDVAKSTFIQALEAGNVRVPKSLDTIGYIDPARIDALMEDIRKLPQPLTIKRASGTPRELW